MQRFWITPEGKSQLPPAKEFYLASVGLLCDSITITLLYLQWWLRNSLPFFNFLFFCTFKNFPGSFQSTPLLVHSTAIQFLWNCQSCTGISHDSSSRHIIRIPGLLVNYEFGTLVEDTIRHHRTAKITFLRHWNFPKITLKYILTPKPQESSSSTSLPNTATITDLIFQTRILLLGSSWLGW